MFPDGIATISLPTPRLEFVWTKQDPVNGNWSERICTYNLVLKLNEFDIRNEDKTNQLVIELGSTKCSGGRNDREMNYPIDTPFRDTAHASWDSQQLGKLPLFSICEDKATEYTFDSTGVLRSIGNIKIKREK